MQTPPRLVPRAIDHGADYVPCATLDRMPERWRERLRRCRLQAEPARGGDPLNALALTRGAVPRRRATRVLQRPAAAPPPPSSQK